MSKEKPKHTKERLHIRNRNRENYDLKALKVSNPEIGPFIQKTKYGTNSIDFSNPVAVKVLNQALLNHYYGITNWNFPDENLCPPIPGRADYLHYIADMFAENNAGEIPKDEKITCLDVGVGASCIYPIIGVTEYGWQFIGSDIDAKSIASAEQIVKANESLADNVSFRLQPDKNAIFNGIITNEDKIDITICNPPFHASLEEATKGTQRKVKNLAGKKDKKPTLNFAGISSELVCKGGELQFINTMIAESKTVGKNCLWFSTLVSKQNNLFKIYDILDKIGVQKHKTIATGTGNKASRIVAWTFLTKEEHKAWIADRWNS